MWTVIMVCFTGTEPVMVLWAMECIVKGPQRIPWNAESSTVVRKTILYSISHHPRHVTIFPPIFIVLLIIIGSISYYFYPVFLNVKFFYMYTEIGLFIA